MQNNMRSILSYIISFISVFTIVISVWGNWDTCYSNENKYPMKVMIIDKGQAKYNSPENALSALSSALKKEDLEWAAEALHSDAHRARMALIGWSLAGILGIAVAVLALV